MNAARTVLVVDDDPDIRGFISLALGMDGYEVREARNGRDALDKASGQQPDLILLDLQMPVMDGWQFIGACRADQVCSDVPIVIMSAGHRVGEAGKLGATAFLAKPFDMDDLSQVVGDIAERRGSAS